MEQTPVITVGAVSLFVEGDQVVITHKGKAGVMQVNVAASRLERWARAILREEAFAPAQPAADTEQPEAA